MSVRIALLGDIILDVPNPDHWLGGVAAVTRSVDLAIGHLEVPHTRRGQELVGDVPAPGADPDHLAALTRADIRMLSMAGNHIADCGAIGIADTVAELDRLGIAHSGAGKDLATALAPAIVERGGRTIALLSYNCVGPEIAWAGENRAGCAFVRVRADDGGPARPQATLVDADPASIIEMQDRISDLRQQADVVLVALHKGITHRPAELAAYERPLSHAAIDAGADAVMGHHAHIIRGIELYRDRPIFHGLGNGVVVTEALSPGQDHPARAEWAERRRRMFGFEPDPAYHLAPFHPQAVNGMVGLLDLADDGALHPAYLPMWSAPPGRPEVARGERREVIRRYVADISAAANLPPCVMSERGDWLYIASG